MNKRSGNTGFSIRSIVAPDIEQSQFDGTTMAPLGTPENPSDQILTTANVITTCRFLLTLVFLVLFVQHDEGTRVIALTCYAIAAITDFLDGQVARRTQTVSWLGKVMDPIMDRVLLFTGVLGLVTVGELPLWIAVYVVCRDIYLAYCAMILRKYRKRPLDVIYVGKAATALLMTGFALMLIGIPQVVGLGLVPFSWLPGLNGSTVSIGIYFVYVGVVCSLVAAVIYTVRGLRIRRDVLALRAGGDQA